MKIGIFSELYPPSVGGQEIRYQELAQVLRLRGHEVSVFCIGHQGGLPPQTVENGIAVHRHPIDPNYKRPGGGLLRRSPVTIARFAAWAGRQARAGGFDFCLYNEFPFLHILTIPGRLRARAMIDWCEIRGGAYRAIQSFLPRLTAFNAGVSVSVAEQIAAASGKTVFHLPSGIHAAAYHALPRKARDGLLYLGRLAPHKNILLLIDAFALLRQEGYRGRLRIAGDGPDREAIKAHLEKSPAREAIDLLGSVDDDRKIELLSQAELLTITSRREGLPRVIVEAMASGTPTVTADFPENGSCTAVRYYDCGVITGQSAEAFAAGVRRALAKWDVFSAQGLVRAPELDWSRLADELEAHISKRS